MFIVLSQGTDTAESALIADLFFYDFPFQIYLPVNSEGSKTTKNEAF